MTTRHNPCLINNEHIFHSEIKNYIRLGILRKKPLRKKKFLGTVKNGIDNVMLLNHSYKLKNHHTTSDRKGSHLFLQWIYTIIVLTAFFSERAVIITVFGSPYWYIMTEITKGWFHSILRPLSSKKKVPKCTAKNYDESTRNLYISWSVLTFSITSNFSALFYQFTFFLFQVISLLSATKSITVYLQNTLSVYTPFPNSSLI